MQAIVEGLGLSGGRLMFSSFVTHSGVSKREVIIQNAMDLFLIRKQEAMDRWIAQNRQLFDRAQVVSANEILRQHTGILIWNMVDRNTNQKYHLIVPPVAWCPPVTTTQPESFGEEEGAANE